MKMLKCIAVVTTIVLALAAQVGAAGGTTTSDYTVPSTTDEPGLDTGLVLQKGRSVTVTASETVCPNTGYCVSPDGTSVVDTTQSNFGGFVLPGAPAYGLVGRVGAARGCRSAVGRRSFPGRGRSCSRSTMTFSVTTGAASWSLCPTRNPACRARVGQDGARRPQPRALRAARSRQQAASAWANISAHTRALERARRFPRERARQFPRERELEEQVRSQARERRCIEPAPLRPLENPVKAFSNSWVYSHSRTDVSPLLVAAAALRTADLELAKHPIELAIR